MCRFQPYEYLCRDCDVPLRDGVHIYECETAQGGRECGVRRHGECLRMKTADLCRVCYDRINKQGGR